VTIEWTTGASAALNAGRQDRLTSLYREVYAAPPYFEGEEDAARYGERLNDETRQPGFAVALADCGGDLIGFAYGFTFAPDKWWSTAGDPPAEVSGWPTFAVMEFVVASAFRRRGVGRELMTKLLADRPEPYATLCSNPAAAARAVYRAWGWHEVAKSHPPNVPHMDVLLLKLPLEALKASVRGVTMRRQ
jgi:GNAT superfamily N-acetyltransferase